MYLTKRKDGAYIPSANTDYELSKKIAIGSEVKATTPRNVQFHRKGFALINLAFENQDKYDSLEVFRKILTIKAGYFDEVEGKNGDLYYLPQSLSFEKMNAEKFEKWFNSTLEVIARETETSPEVIRQEIEGFY